MVESSSGEEAFLTADAFADNLPRQQGLEVHTISPDRLLDSSQCSVNDWVWLAQQILSHYNDFDGFVILHGTDTLAYSASALSFMLAGLQKPLVITGAQLPLLQVGSDGRMNLEHAFLVASGRLEKFAGVFVQFAGKLLLGCRTTKVSATKFAAFDSPNYSPIGEFGATWHVASNWRQLLPESATSATQEPLPDFWQNEQLFTGSVGQVYLTPTISVAQIQAISQQCDALVIQGYGTGNFPVTSAYIALYKDLVAQQKPVVIVSQCPHGSVSTEAYASGKMIDSLGLIAGFDMTVEAATAKLVCALAQHTNLADLKNWLNSNQCNEINSTPRYS